MTELAITIDDVLYLHLQELAKYKHRTEAQQAQRVIEEEMVRRLSDYDGQGDELGPFPTLSEIPQFTGELADKLESLKDPDGVRFTVNWKPT
jgi:hypothetical protein